MTHIAAIDAGASEIKVSVFDASGREVASAARDCPSDSPSAGWAQCSPDVLMRWPMEVLKEAVGQSKVAASDIVAIGVTGSRATILPVDGDGKAVGPVIFWYDRRGNTPLTKSRINLERMRFFVGLAYRWIPPHRSQRSSGCGMSNPRPTLPPVFLHCHRPSCSTP